MNTYQLVLYTHIICALLTFLFFMLRGYWMIRDSDLLHLKTVRVLPHVIDTVLLLSAIALTVILNQYPFISDWLTVKLIALVLYISVGTIALKRGKTKTNRIIAFMVSVTIFGFIVSVAYFHHPLGIFHLVFA